VGGKLSVKSAIIIVFTCLSFGFSLFLFSLYLFKGSEPSQKTSPKNFNFKRVQYRFQIWNTQNQPISGASFYVHAPLELTSAQRCIRIESSYPYELVTDSLGNQVLKFSFETFPPLASKVISIKANLMLANTPVSIAKTEFASTVVSDSDAADIRGLANQLKSKTTRSTAENIYRWVADNITYTGYLKHAKGAHQTLVSKKGDCTEFADLFVALAQAVNIPARRVSGYLSHENGVLRPVDFHDWAEFYENGVWHIADSQQRNFDANYPDYIAMKIYDQTSKESPMGGFYRFYVDGKGLKAKMDS